MVWVAAAIAIGSIPSKTYAGIGYEVYRHGRIGYHVVTADLSNGNITAQTVHLGGVTSVWNLLARSRPMAAITGTFFSPTSRKPVADLLIEGNLVARGSIGSAVGMSWYGGIRIFDVPYRTPADWSTYRFGLRGAVRVVANGSVRPNPKAQRFRDRRIWGKAARTGLGLTKNGKLVFFATRSKVTLSELGKAMRAKGVVDGVSLDGGGSTCLYYHGSLVVPPKRLLNNIVVITAKSSEIAALEPAAHVAATKVSAPVPPKP